MRTLAPITARGAKSSRVLLHIFLDRRIEALDALFETFKNSTLVISYKRFGVPCIDTLVRMLKKHGRKVRSFSRHYKYALNHQNGEAHLNREVLLIAEGRG